jgi:hypothetical protein
MKVVCPLVSWSRGTGSLDATVVVRPRAEGVHLAWDDQGPDHVTDQDLPCLGEGTQVAGVCLATCCWTTIPQPTVSTTLAKASLGPSPV